MAVTNAPPMPMPIKQGRPEQVRDELGVIRRERQPDEAAREDEERSDERPLGAESADDGGDESGDDHEGDGQRQLGQSGGERVVAEHGLHVDGEREEQRDHRLPR